MLLPYVFGADWRIAHSPGKFEAFFDQLQGANQAEWPKEPVATACYGDSVCIYIYTYNAIYIYTQCNMYVYVYIVYK